MTWPDQQVQQLNAISLRAGSVEACGLILGRRTNVVVEIERLSHCENHATSPELGFRIPAGHLMEWDKKAAALGLQIVGVWHSHPGGNPAPSPSDLTEIPADWLGLIVVPAANGCPKLQTYGRNGLTPTFVHV